MITNQVLPATWRVVLLSTPTHIQRNNTLNHEFKYFYSKSNHIHEEIHSHCEYNSYPICSLLTSKWQLTFLWHFLLSLWI